MPDITMPQLGETVTEGTITKWMKKVGDNVEEDEVIYEVSTDKVDSEVPSSFSGTLTEILVQEGETVAVGALLARIGDAGAAPAAPPAEAAAAPAPETKGDEVEAAKAEQAGQPETERAPEPAAAPAPQAAPAPAQAQAPAAAASSAPVASSMPAAATTGGGKVLSPVVRRLIAENNLDAAQIQGTGAGGRITRADVQAVIESGGARSATPTAAAAPAKAVAVQPLAKAGTGDTVVAFSNIRKRTAEHMRRSLDTSAHTLVVIEVDYDNVDKVRNKAKSGWKAEEGFSLSYLPFIARATVDAIREFPNVNASVGDNQLIVHNEVNLGFAVDLSFEGLIVPVVHNADAKRLRAIARELSELSTRARSKKLAADDISGGTFTITNAGGYGTLITGPIINQPQVCILSTDGIKPKPVAIPLPDGGYGIAVHPLGNLAISFDHRAYDGAYASAFLARIKEILETRDWQQEL
ncbi:MAG TPA: dihydrolipoamide acetyltransferase family protein [Acidimicrobiales bacterium]|nr:dihydrolipoamide acetyltransferase family protein [Acidimicrobiales bacterium]